MSFLRNLFTNGNGADNGDLSRITVDRTPPGSGQICPAGGHRINTPHYTINVCNRSRPVAPPKPFIPDEPSPPSPPSPGPEPAPAPMPEPFDDADADADIVPGDSYGNGDNLAGRAPRWFGHNPVFNRDGANWSWRRYQRRYGDRHRDQRYWERRGDRHNYWYFRGSRRRGRNHGYSSDSY